MKILKIVLSYALLHATIMLINAQTINGLYVNEDRNEFVIIKNDTVQFRHYNDDAFATYTLGEGVLKMKRQGRFIIQPLLSFTEKTSVMYRRQRSDSRLSILFLTQDSIPISDMWIKLSLLQNKSKHNVGISDMHGQWTLNEELIDSFNKKDVLIYSKLLGYTETEKRTLLERGYEYIIRTNIPDIFSGVVVRGNKSKIEIRQLNKDEISIGRKTKLKKISNDYSCACFPFAMDVISFLQHCGYM